MKKRTKKILVYTGLGLGVLLLFMRRSQIASLATRAIPSNLQQKLPSKPLSFTKTVTTA